MNSCSFSPESCQRIRFTFLPAGTKDDVLDPGNRHYAGIYAGQFECYEHALTAAGKKVLAKVIYYHVLGTGVELFYE